MEQKGKGKCLISLKANCSERRKIDRREERGKKMDPELIPIVIAGGVVVGLVVLIKSLNRKRLNEEATKIVKTRIVDVSSSSKSTTRTSTGSAVGRAIVGGALGGPVGAAVGASTAKRKTQTENTDTVVFKVWYKNGTSEIKKVQRNSDYYNKYLEFLED